MSVSAEVMKAYKQGKITKEFLAGLTAHREDLDTWDMYRLFLIGEYRKEWEAANPGYKLNCLTSDNCDGPYFYSNKHQGEVLWQELEAKYGPEVAHIRKAFWKNHRTKNTDI